MSWSSPARRPTGSSRSFTSSCTPALASTTRHSRSRPKRLRSCRSLRALRFPLTLPSPPVGERDVMWASAHVACMTQGVAAGLGPDGEAVGLFPHGDLRHLAGGGVEDVYDVVIASGEPELLAVGAHVAHVRAPAPGDRPVRLDPARGEIDDGDTALAARWAMHVVRAAVGDVELGPVPARIEAVRAFASLDEIDLLEGLAVDHEAPVGPHIGHEEDLAVRGHADVLGHAAPGQLEIPQDLAARHVDLGQAALELAREDGEAAVDGEVGVVDARALRHRE